MPACLMDMRATQDMEAMRDTAVRAICPVPANVRIVVRPCVVNRPIAAHQAWDHVVNGSTFPTSIPVITIEADSMPMESDPT